MADSIDYNKITEAVAKGMRGGGGNSSAASGFGGSQLSDSAVGIAGLKKGFDSVASGVKKYVDVMEGSLEPWRRASNTGANFNNDVVRMTIAAKGSRLSLDELAGIVTDNAKNFTGLGGSVTKGAEAFTRLSSKMFENTQAMDSLRQLGYTNKELNDVLAMQIGFTKSSMRNDAASQEESIIAATKLAGEMDAMAKLTGKSREEQKEAMNKAKADMALEAKFRLIGIEKGADAEKAARDNFTKQFAEAEARGQGQVFKEVFATGTVVSKEAAMTASITGEAARQTAIQAKEFADGNYAAAEAASKQSWAAVEQNNKNVALLSLATVNYTGNAASQAVTGMMTQTDSYTHAIRKIREEDEFRNASSEKVHQEAMNRIKAQQTADGGATDAFLKLQARASDAQAAIYEGLVTPMYKDALPAIKTFSNKLDGVVNIKGADGTTRQGNLPGTLTTTLSDAYNTQRGRALDPALEANRLKPGEKVTGGSGVITEVGGAVSKLAGAGVNLIETATEKLTGKPAAPVQKFSSGGQATGPESGYQVTLHGEEIVIPNKDLEATLGGVASKLPRPQIDAKSFAESMTADINKGISKVLPSGMPQVTTTSKSSTSTTITGGTETTKTVKQSPEAESIAKEIEEVRSKFMQDWSARKSILTEGMALEDKKFSKVQEMMDADESAQKIKEAYTSKIEELSKKEEAARKSEVVIKTTKMADSISLLEEEANAQIENLKQVESSKLSIRAGMSEKELEQIKKDASNAMSVIGTNVKGLSEDAVMSLLPAKADLEDFYIDINGTIQSFSADAVNKMKSTTETFSKDLTGMVESQVISPGSKIHEAISTVSKTVSTSVDTLIKDASTVANEVKTSATTPNQGTAPKLVEPKKEVPRDFSQTKMTIGRDGLPIMSAVQKKAESIPNETAKTPPAASPGATPTATTPNKPAGTSTPPAPSQQSSGAADKASLSDVVNRLDRLNTQISKLIDQHAEIGKRQVKATNATSQNIYAR
jgi:hypothetical protein